MCIIHLDVPLSVQTSTYILGKHTQRQTISGKYIKKKKTQPSRWATNTPTLSLTQHTGERQVRQTGTAQ